MKKTGMFLVTLLLLFFLNVIPCNAAEPQLKAITTNTTEQGVSYVVYSYLDEYQYFASQRTSAFETTKEVRFSGIVSPPRTLEWSETINNRVFTGTLKLSSFYVTSNQETVATYKGMLTSE